MVKNKIILEEKLQEAIEVAGPYKIPTNWVWKNLREISNIVTGNTPSKKHIEYYGDEIPFIKPNDLNQGRRLIKANEMLSAKGAEKARILPKGSIAVCCIGSIGKTAFLEVEGATNQQINSIVPKLTNNLYVYYYVLSDYFQKALIQNSSATTISIINKSKMGELSIPIPPLSEQQRIISKIEKLIKKLNKVKYLIEETKNDFENRKSVIVEKAFRGDLTKNFRKINNLKLNFDKVLLGSLIESGPQNGLYKPKSEYGEGYKIVRIDNFYNGKINEWHTLKKLKLTEEDVKKYSLKNGDIIINRVNSIEYLGKSALIRNLKDICVFESNIMRIRLKKSIDPEYITYYLNSISGLKELRKTAKHAVNQASINQKDVKNTLIALPSLKEQKEIVKILNKILSNENRVEKLIDIENKLEFIKKLVLSKAFRGKLGTNKIEEKNELEI